MGKHCAHCFTCIISLNLIKWSKALTLASSLFHHHQLVVHRYLLATVIVQVLPFGIVDWDPMPSGVSLGALSRPHGKSLEHRWCPLRVCFPSSAPSVLALIFAQTYRKELNSPLKMKSGPKSLPSDWVLLASLSPKC